MLALPEALNTKDLCPLLDLNERSVRRRAVREGWQRIHRAKKLGGDKWLLRTMPKETQRQIKSALALEAASKQLVQPVNADRKKGRCHNLNGIPEHGKRVAEARMFVRNYALNLRETTGEPLSNILFDVARQFKERTDRFPEWIYQNLRGASRCSIRNWIRQAGKEGPRRLAKNYERRPPRSVMGTHEKLQAFLVGMIEKFPHISGIELHRAAVAFFGPASEHHDPSLVIPSERRVQAWFKRWKQDNAQLYAHMQSPDGWRSKYGAAFGDAAAHVEHLNQEWQADSTKCDLLLNDGKRHMIVGIIDVYSRRVRFHVSRTSSAAAVSSCLRKAIIDWGVPQILKTDNGTDYASQHIQRVLSGLGIIQEFCPPFTPQAKPYIERVFKTLLHSHITLLPGYIGHNVAERKAIESRKSFASRQGNDLLDKNKQIELALSPEKLQQILDEWAEYVYGNDPHRGIDGMTPNAKVAAYQLPVNRLPDERALDTLLLPVPGGNGLRVVTKTGIRITGDIHGLKIKGTYIGTDVSALKGQTVLVRFDDTCPGRVLLSDPDTGEYLGKGENPDLLGWSSEKIRQVAIAVGRQQKTMIARERKKAREAAKLADGIADIIMRDAIAKHNALPPAPPENTVIYTTPALEQAARARTGDFTPPTEEEQAKAHAAVAHLFEPEQPKGLVVPESMGGKLELWRSFYDRRIAGEALEAEEQSWFRSFAHTPYCQAYCRNRGLDISIAFAVNE
jgi:transposase InsO family protein